LFQIRVPRQITVHFDPTTIALHWALQREATPGDKTALEVGIGQGALLSNSLQKRSDIHVEGIDCSESRVNSSREVAQFNDLEADYFVSDLFTAVKEGRHFDLIFFNPPYVPTGQGQRLRLTRHMRADSDRVWDGGEDGGGVLREFLLQAHHYLSHRGRILFGVQPIFLADNLSETIIAECNWEIRERYKPCCIPSVVYVLGHDVRGSQPASQ
jgi:release factor glutamine methyltransferase